ncbi:type III-B CRISPR module RAMP protein Cmr6 [Acidilobus sp.]|uniref:type III-B CRISPR module RAMP protein Cmr6 n=1 Tax=Acidilobus sp. TaxID=1872109 RepID=UPI003D04A49E
MSVQAQRPKNLMLHLIKEYQTKYKDALNGRLRCGKKKRQGSLEDAITCIKSEILNEALQYDFGQNVKLADEYVNEVAEGLTQAGLDVIDVRAKLSTRLLSGAAADFLKVIFEVGMHWDQVLDLPYVPGSSIKGVMRSSLLDLCLERYHAQSDSLAKCVNAVLSLFGSGEKFFEADFFKLKDFKVSPRVGSLVVSNAYPVALQDGRLLEGDIINPHYYRNNDVVKNEYLVMPNPVVHLAVRGGTTFRFVIGVEDLKNADELANVIFNRSVRSSVELALLSLAYALGQGVGARTSKGYGVFNIEGVNDIVIRMTSLGSRR